MNKNVKDIIESNYFTENLLKGRIGESLVESLLKSSENKVYRFGYESILQNLIQLGNGFDRDSDQGKKISSTPDFVVINRESKPFFVEVKFRKDLNLYPKDKLRIKFIEKNWDAKIILVMLENPHFRISVAPYSDNNKEWKCSPLVDDQYFNINMDKLNFCNEMVERYYHKPEITGSGRGKDA